MLFVITQARKRSIFQRGSLWILESYLDDKSIQLREILYPCLWTYQAKSFQLLEFWQKCWFPWWRYNPLLPFQIQNKLRNKMKSKAYGKSKCWLEKKKKNTKTDKGLLVRARWAWSVNPRLGPLTHPVKACVRAPVLGRACPQEQQEECAAGNP